MTTWTDLPFDIKSLILSSALNNAIFARRRQKDKMSFSVARYNLTRQIFSLAAAMPDLREEITQLTETKRDEAVEVHAELTALNELDDRTEFTRRLKEEKLRGRPWYDTLKSEIKEMDQCCALLPDQQLLEYIYDYTIEQANLPGLSEIEADWEGVEWGVSPNWESDQGQHDWVSWEEECARLNNDTDDWDEVGTWYRW